MCVILSSGVAAKGVASIHLSNGTRRVYRDVEIRVMGRRSIRVASHNELMTIVVNQSGCSKVGVLERCQPYWTDVIRSGIHSRLNFLSGWEYVNRSGTAQRIPHAATLLASNGVLLYLDTRRGETIQITGQIDRYYR